MSMESNAGHSSDQDKLWDHFQNEGVAAFDASRGRIEFLVRRLVPPASVLNIGVGAGLLESLSQAKGLDVWSLDPSERAIAKLRAQLGLAQKAQVGYSQAMPFPDGQFDVVVMSEVLEHLDPAVFDATLAEVCRVLRPGGRFIGTVPARERLADAQVVCPHCGEQFHRWGHKQSFDAGQLRAALAPAFPGCEISEHFFIEWEAVGWRRRCAGLLKKALSWRGVGTYGANRNLYFEGRTAG